MPTVCRIPVAEVASSESKDTKAQHGADPGTRRKAATIVLDAIVVLMVAYLIAGLLGCSVLLFLPRVMDPWVDERGSEAANRRMSLARTLFFRLRAHSHVCIVGDRIGVHGTPYGPGTQNA